MYGLEAGETYQTCEKPGSCEASEVTIFIAEWCVACETQVPEIMELATRLGLGARHIDVNSTDPEERRRARHVEWVPHIEYK